MSVLSRFVSRSTVLNTISPVSALSSQVGSFSTSSENAKIKLNPALKIHIKECGDRIFGNRPIVPYRTGFKYLLQKPYGSIAMNYYMKDSTKHFKKMSPEFETEEGDRRVEQLHRMRRKGKGPPKKGAGKRAMKAAAKGKK